MSNSPGCILVVCSWHRVGRLS